ncbi:MULTISPECIES: Fic family protein [unclassified Pseudofrankia]|uniref:Fic/DOC family protein n=1 Tax=unclassified Pseudofrankia TaxID=2994372 RepID=UPI0009F6F17C|nr:MULTISPECIES: Fic family protein [unclassified Pseudofrankia]MDT3440657.1 Fic family protein [Pseudofrankia sp. BMG5.37]
MTAVEDEDPYCWPGAACLRNLLDIRDADELSKAEHELVGIRTAELTASVVPGAYDTAHLLRFHRLLFRDVYDWAGQLRTGNISKGDVSFCDAQLVPERLDQLFAKLAVRRFLVPLEWDGFVMSFASLYGELNAIHPFREGNGRTQRAFLRQLAAHAGWTVAWQSLERRANDKACGEYLRTSRPHALIRLLAPAIEPRLE